MAKRSSRNEQKYENAGSHGPIKAPELRRMFQFGGSLLKKSNAKTARPLSTKKAMHVVLRSSRATGEWSLRNLRNQKIIERILRRLAKEYGIKIHEFGNAGDHLHLLIRLKNRSSFAPFIRALTGTIALQVTKANKLTKLKEKFWDYRPWTRILELKKAYTLAKDSLIQHHLAAIGYLAYRPRTLYESYFLKGAPS